MSIFQKLRVLIKMVLGLSPLYILACFLTAVSSQEVTLQLKYGEIKGKIEAQDRVEYSAFRGIPYAKPPIGDFRLKDPESHSTWPSTLDATKFGSKCPQLDLQGNMIGNEDCLYINVFTLTPVPSNIKYPVMVFIHGDDFQSGSADEYEPGRFLENKIVLVTFNYRIGILGFLSTGDSACPGNLGLKDQLFALKWVQENIDVFGGDSSSITLFGQGAGAASVFLHILSPRSGGIFHRAITQSGSPLCHWAMEEKPYDSAFTVAQRLRCNTKTTKAMVECIRGKNVKDLLLAQRDDTTFGGYPLHFLPVVEKGGFLPDTPENILNAGRFPQIPLLSGVNKDDGAMFYTEIIYRQEQLKKDSSFLLNKLIPWFVLNATDIRGNIEAVSHALYFHYFNGIDPTNLTQVLQPFINMTTDAMFVSCNYKTLQLYSAKGAHAYMYTFEYKGSNSMLDVKLGQNINYNGVSHGDELLYLFDIKASSSDRSAIDKQMERQLPYMWTLFASSGESPTVGTGKIEPFSSEVRNYLRIDRGQTVEISYRQKEIDLWLDYIPKLSQIKATGDQGKVKIGGFGWTMMALVIILVIVVIVLAVMLVRKSKSQYFASKTEDK